MRAENLADDDKHENRHQPGKQKAEQRRSLRGDFRRKLHALGVYQPLGKIVIRPYTGFENSGIAFLILRGEHEHGILQSHLLDLARIEHFEKRVVRNFHHRAGQQGGEQEGVEQHQYNECDNIVVNQRFAR